MHCLPFLLKSTLPLAFLFLFSQLAFAQESRPLRFSEDIGIDFAPFLRGQSGASLLYKHKFSLSTDSVRLKRFALRVLAGYYEEPNNGSSLNRRVDDTTFSFDYTGRAKHQFLRFGAEYQASKKDFRFYFGADLGYRYWTSALDHQTIAQVSSMRFVTDQYQSKSKHNVVEASLLAGVNYFFLPRFSIGLEANVSLGVEFSSSKTIRNGMTTFTNSNTIFEVDTSLWRLLYLSYHFGTPSKAAN